MNLKDYIATIPDYPKEGIEFRDISPLMADGNALSHILHLCNFNCLYHLLIERDSPI